MLTDIFATEPDFVNADGVKWWRDESGTRYAARQVDENDKQLLPKVNVWLVETPSGERNYLIINGQEIVYETKSLEGIGVQIDIMAMDLKYEAAGQPAKPKKLSP